MSGETVPELGMYIKNVIAIDHFSTRGFVSRFN